MPKTVSTAISSDVVTASIRSWLLKIAAYEFSVRLP